MKIFKKIFKIVISLFISFVILNLLCLLYYNTPRHTVNNTLATDYKWESNFFYSRGTEGYAQGKTNNEGFNNLFDYYGQQIDILLLGSSHIEAFNVNQNKNTASLINKYKNKNIAYNIGVSGHTIYTIAQNFNNAVNVYHPKKYAIIETSCVVFDKNKLKQVNTNTYPEIPSYDKNSLVYKFQNFRFLRLAYSQLKQTLIAKNNSNNSNNSIKNNINIDYTMELNTMLNTINNISKKNNINTIIVFHPNITVSNNMKANSSLSNEEKNALKKYKELCNNYDHIQFLDMTNTFIEQFNKNNSFPHGFSNSHIGKGHLNINGHTMISNELIKIIYGGQ